MNIVEKEIYNDNWFDRLFIWFFARKMAAALGQDTNLTGYDGLVDLSHKVVQGNNAQGQQAVIGRMLRSLIPPFVLWGIRTLFAPTRLILEWNAWFATRIFGWLVGPCDWTEVEVEAPDGTLRRQKSGVHIQKCRYLDESRCVGMCINMCKLPTQEFFAQEFGFPLTMTPNFEDFSCDMAFGRPAPALTEEAEYQHPCLSDCRMASSAPKPCPKVRET